MKRGWLIVVSIIGGIVLSCVLLPLGALSILASSGEDSTGPMPPTRWGEQRLSGSGLDRVVVIEIDGVIGGAADNALFGTQLSHDHLLSQIRQATEDARVKAVVVRVTSPGGGVVESNELHGALKKLRAANKHVVISMGHTAASGGYYIATAGERIYANPDTLTGSLGVIVSLLNYQEVYAKLGLKETVYKSGEFKDIGSPTRPPTEAEQEIWRALIDQAYQGFVDVIAEGRNLPREEVLRIADGRIYTGKQALDLKLVDVLGGQDEAIAGAQELAGLQNALVVRYRSSSSLRNLLLSNLEQQRPSDPLGLRAIVTPQAPKVEYRLVP